MAHQDYKPREGELRMVGVIERQQAEIERLRAALKSIADYAPTKNLPPELMLVRGIARNMLEE